jgi:hypothetical protein
MKIIYLGNPHDFDTYTARMLWRWLNTSTGNRGLVVFHQKAHA